MVMHADVVCCCKSTPEYDQGLTWWTSRFGISRAVPPESQLNVLRLLHSLHYIPVLDFPAANHNNMGGYWDDAFATGVVAVSPLPLTITLLHRHQP